MREHQTTQSSEIPGIEATSVPICCNRLVEQADVEINLPELEVRFGEAGFDRDRALEIADGGLVRKAVRQAPGELTAREIGLGEIRVLSQRLFDREKRLLFPAPVGVDVEEALRIRAAERRLGQRELWIGLYGLLEKCQ